MPISYLSPSKHRDRPFVPYLFPVDMGATLAEKVPQYERLLEEALAEATVVGPTHAPLGEAGEDCLSMAAAYLEDGRHFIDGDDPVNALAAFAYAHGWLDAGARIGVLDVPTEGELFTV